MTVTSHENRTLRPSVWKNRISDATKGAVQIVDKLRSFAYAVHDQVLAWEEHSGT